MTRETVSNSMESLIEIESLTVTYSNRRGLFNRGTTVRVLDQFTLTIYQGETLGIVGESGCGKSTLANAILRLVPAEAGVVRFQQQDLLAADKTTLRQLRSHMQMIFQNPFSSLNPRMSVRDLIAEPLVTHTDLRGFALTAHVLTLFSRVGLAKEHLSRYAHQLSGGQAQRVAIARALALNPQFLVLDEPTSALDVSVQAQIINLLTQLQREHQLTYLFISHDLGVVQHISDRIAVMYLGEIVELADSEAIFQTPQHPYTQALISATPRPIPNSQRQRIVLQGNVPSPANPPAGCRFHTRCPHAFERCREVTPRPRAVSHSHLVSCHLEVEQIVN